MFRHVAIAMLVAMSGQLLVGSASASGTVVEGALTRVSKLPDPAKSDYKDCYFTSEFDVSNVVSGEMSTGTVVVIFPGFYERKLTSEAKYKVGDRLRARLIPFDALPQGKQFIQQVDELENFNSEIFFASESQAAGKQEVAGGSNPRKRVAYVSGFATPLNPPLPREVVESRTEAMRRDLETATTKLNGVEKHRATLSTEFDHDWTERQKELVPVGNGYRWGEAGKGHFTLPEKYNPFVEPEWNKAALPALKDLNEYLAFHNIQLVVVVIPDMFQVASRVLMPQYAAYADQSSLSAVKTLLENDIEAVDVFDALVEEAKNYPFMFFYDKISDSHPEYGTVDVETTVLAPRLKRFERIAPAESSPARFSLVDAKNPSCRVWPVNTGGHKQGEAVLAKKVLLDGKEVSLVNKASPFMVIGNSFAGTPGWGAFSCFVGMKTGVVPYHCEIAGGGLSFVIPKRLLVNRDVLLRKKMLCLMPVGIGQLAGRWLNIKELDKQMGDQSSSRLVATIPSDQLAKAFAPNAQLRPEVLWTLPQEGLPQAGAPAFTAIMLPAGKAAIRGLPLPKNLGEGNLFVKLTLCRPGSKRRPFLMVDVNGEVLGERMSSSPVELTFALEGGKQRTLDVKLYMRNDAVDIGLSIGDMKLYQAAAPNGGAVAAGKAALCAKFPVAAKPEAPGPPPAMMDKVQESVVEGALTRVSKLPDPAKSDYKDCYFTSEFDVSAVISGQVPGNRIVVLFPAFTNRKLTPEAKLKPGDKLRLKLIPFESLPQEAQTIQQADDLEGFATEIFFAKGAERLDQLSASQAAPRKNAVFNYVSGFAKPLNAPLPPAVLDARKTAIQHDLAEAKAKLAALENAKGEGLAARYVNDRKLREPELTPVGKTFLWGRNGKSCFALPVDYNPFLGPPQDGVPCRKGTGLMDDKRFVGPAIDAVALESLKSLNEYLAFNNVQLVVVLFPDMFQVASRLALPQYAPYQDERSLRIEKALLENDIEVINPFDQLVAEAGNYPFLFYYDRLYDNHPDGAVDVATKLLAQRLERFKGVAAPKFRLDAFAAVDCENPEGRLWPLDFDGHKKKDVVLTKRILLNGQDPNNFAADSPFLVIDDSYSRTPGWNAFPAFCGMKTGIVPCYCGFSGYGLSTTIPKWLLVRREMLLKGKMVCLMPVGFWAFSHNRWVNVRTVDKLMSTLDGAVLVQSVPRPRIAQAISPMNELSPLERDKVVAFGKATKRDISAFHFFKLHKGKASINGLPLSPVAGSEGKLVVKIVLLPTISLNDNVVCVNGQPQSNLMLAEPQELFFSLDKPAETLSLAINCGCKWEVLMGIKDIEVYRRPDSGNNP